MVLDALIFLVFPVISGLKQSVALKCYNCLSASGECSDEIFEDGGGPSIDCAPPLKNCAVRNKKWIGERLRTQRPVKMVIRKFPVFLKNTYIFFVIFSVSEGSGLEHPCEHPVIGDWWDPFWKVGCPSRTRKLTPLQWSFELVLRSKI